MQWIVKPRACGYAALAMVLIYKIVAAHSWEDARHKGRFDGAAIDLADGYIHLSDASQAEETARRHFANQDGLLLVAFDSASFGPELRWERSRGGALFPHVYGSLDPARALWAKPLAWTGDVHQFPQGWQR
jgi:uncharacterized protein (DUF952 family)